MRIYNEGYDLFSVVKNEARASAQEGTFYSISTGIQTVTVLSPFLAVQLTNPSNSDTSFSIQSVLGGSSAQANLDIFRNATFAAAGTALTPRNTNFGFSDSSAATAKFIVAGTDPTTGGARLYSMITAAGTAFLDFNLRIIVPPSQSFLIRLQNTSLTSLTASISIDWAEA